jgi:hypothetical protein
MIPICFAGTPAEFLTNLNVASGIHKFSLSREGYGFLLEILEPPSEDELRRWSTILQGHVKQSERVAAQQIDSTYCSFIRVGRGDFVEFCSKSKYSGSSKYLKSGGLLPDEKSKNPYLSGSQTVVGALNAKATHRTILDEEQIFEENGDRNGSGAVSRNLGGNNFASVMDVTEQVRYLVNVYFSVDEGIDVVDAACAETDAGLGAMVSGPEGGEDENKDENKDEEKAEDDENEESHNKDDTNNGNKFNDSKDSADSSGVRTSTTTAATTTSKSTSILSALLENKKSGSEDKNTLAKHALSKSELSQRARARKFGYLSEALGLSPQFLEEMEDSQKVGEKQMWTTHPGYSDLLEDIRMHVPAVSAAAPSGNPKYSIPVIIS